MGPWARARKEPPTPLEQQTGSTLSCPFAVVLHLSVVVSAFVSATPQSLASFFFLHDFVALFSASAWLFSLLSAVAPHGFFLWPFGVALQSTFGDFLKVKRLLVGPDPLVRIRSDNLLDIHLQDTVRGPACNN